MSRTFVRQDTQIRNSDAYTDNVSPGATMESTPVNVEDDLNNLRSQVNRILANQTGNWHDDLASFSNIDGETKKRSISTLNSELDALELKRVLCRAQILTDISVDPYENWVVLSVSGSEGPSQVSAIGAGTDRGAVTALAVTSGASVAATGTLTNTANFSNGEQVVTGTKTYTFQTALTDVDGNVLIGASASDSLDNLIAAINLGAGSGSLYAASTTANGFVSAAAGAGDTMDVTALTTGTPGNSVVTTETAVNASWGAGTLAGGTAGFDSNELVEVAGSVATNPKNLVVIRDASTGEVVTSGGRSVYGLLQSESTAVSGNAFDDVSTGDRVKISFVRQNATLDDLELCPIADIAGKDINYAYIFRDRLEDYPEDCFLPNGSFLDLSATVTVTRQEAYDTQGTTPVELSTNADLDLAASVQWTVRDAADADLLNITEGSGGGTSTIVFGADVDTFDNNALANDFATGATINSGGTRPIAVGETDGVIESTAGDLRINGTGELYLDDGNQPVSWAQTDGVKLSDTATEWSDYETAFGGEVSLLNAIVQAASSKMSRNKCVAVVTGGNQAADTNITGTGGGTNLDANLCDYSAASVTFLTDVDVYLNGVLLRNGANAAANNDVYPGDTPANGDLKFEFSVKGSGSNPDVITMIVWDDQL